MALRIEESTVRASATKGARSLLSYPTNSTAKFLASAAEPPFSAIYKRPPFK